MQEALRPNELIIRNINNHELNPPVLENELLGSDIVLFVLEENVVSRCQVICNYKNKDPEPEIPPGNRLIRRVVVTEEGKIIPLAFTHPIRAEMEIEKFTRKRFSDDFDKQSNSIQCISVPFQMFIDGFGLYRNSYRSIMGFYMIIGALTFQERTRRANVLPITLGPHGQNFEDVVTHSRSYGHWRKGS